VPPPCNPLPLAVVIPVMVPLPAAEHAHAVPFHCRTCLALQVFTKLKLSAPLVPPPASPLPVAVVTPVMVPAPGNFCPATKLTLPVWSTLNAVPLMARVESVPLGKRVSVSRTSLLPFTSRVAAGAVVLMPICELFWKINESMISLVVSHMGMKSTTPLPVTVGFAA
jgi:hypothetical protein